MSDRLDRALRVLRERETGTHPRAEETLQRVLSRRRAAKVTTLRRVRLWLPIAAVLAISTGALARWGWLGMVTSPSPRVGETATVQVDAVPAGSRAPSPSPSTNEVSATVQPEEGPALLPAPMALPATPASRRRFAPVATPVVAPAQTSAAAESTGPPAASQAPSEAEVYAHAHRLHFDGNNPAAGLAAWDDYLLRFPGGRFAPDARFNRAIDLLKLRRYAEARAALQPFADGAFGGYHRDDARELLRSIP